MTRRLVFLQEAHKHAEWATPRFCRTLVANGQLTRYRISGRVLVDLDELDQLAERGRAEPPAPGAARPHRNGACHTVT